MVTFLRLPYMEVGYQTFNNNMIEFFMSITFFKKTDQAKTIGNVSDFQSRKRSIDPCIS